MRCAVGCCSETNSKKVSFFTFPKDARLLKKWIAFCRREDNFNTKTSVICSQHFTGDDIVNAMEYNMGIFYFI